MDRACHNLNQAAARRLSLSMTAQVKGGPNDDAIGTVFDFSLISAAVSRSPYDDLDGNVNVALHC